MRHLIIVLISIIISSILNIEDSVAQSRPTEVIIVDQNVIPAVRTLTIASGVTTNTSTTPVAGVSGIKNFQWVVTGTGAVTQTVVLKGSFDSDGSYPTGLCTITISGTAPAHDVCPPFTASFPYLFVTTTGTTGTGASGTGKVGY
jgi:hypothetical protein